MIEHFTQYQYLMDEFVQVACTLESVVERLDECGEATPTEQMYVARLKDEVMCAWAALDYHCQQYGESMGVGNPAREPDFLEDYEPVVLTTIMLYLFHNKENA